MQPRPALAQRQHPRRNVGLVVSYRSKDPSAVYDIAHARNISRRGMLLTTARAFAPAARLAIPRKLPFRGSLRRVPGTVEAVGSREIVQNLLYETCVRFIDLGRRSRPIPGDFRAGKAEPLAAPGRSAMHPVAASPKG